MVFTIYIEFKDSKGKTQVVPYQQAPYIGRPFIVNGIAQQTASFIVTNISDDGNEWKVNKLVPLKYQNTIESERVGSLWMKQGEAEHASVASFAKNTLQLLSIAAPPKLLIASQKASIDEINHSKISYELANSFMRQTIVPGKLEVRGSLESGNINQIVRSTIHEGCIEETVSAVEAHHNARMAKTKDIKDYVFNIASDETNHAQLAWDTIRWIIERYTEMKSYARDSFDELLRENQLVTTENDSPANASLCSASTTDDEIQGYGVSEIFTRIKIKKATIEKIIEPNYHFNFQSIESVSKLVPILKI